MRWALARIVACRFRGYNDWGMCIRYSERNAGASIRMLLDERKRNNNNYSAIALTHVLLYCCTTLSTENAAVGFFKKGNSPKRMMSYARRTTSYRWYHAASSVTISVQLLYYTRVLHERARLSRRIREISTSNNILLRANETMHSHNIVMTDDIVRGAFLFRNCQVFVSIYRQYFIILRAIGPPANLFYFLPYCITRVHTCFRFEHIHGAGRCIIMICWAQCFKKIKFENAKFYINMELLEKLCRRI